MAPLSSGRTYRVVKLGGSLFANRSMTALTGRWLRENGDLANLIVCGGGRLVDVLRDWSVAHNLDGETAHWSAIRLMDEMTRLLASRLPEFPLISPSSLPVQFGDANAFLLSSRLLAARSQLPRNWEVSSDSLSAEIATWQGACELCLLKSALPASPSQEEWGKSGFVDPFFRTASAGIPRIRVVDLLTGRSLLASAE
jgi:aspartokinase-like uncharacterized kinase